MSGRYIVFEGGEGSGKSTQARRLAQRIDAIRTFEPGATPLGIELRSLLLGVDQPAIDPRAETLLMAADRAQHLVAVVEPALAAGRHVVSDRSLFSSMAYQGGARGLGLEAVRLINTWAVADRLPDIVVFLDLDPTVASERLARSLDRLEQAGDDFHRAVYDAYRVMAAAEPDSWIVIDAAQTPDEIEAAIWSAIEGRLA